VLRIEEALAQVVSETRETRQGLIECFLIHDGQPSTASISETVDFRYASRQHSGRIVETMINWLRTYEFIAIWLEGIALVLIFVWDSLDGQKQHRETLAQLKIAQRQVDASLDNASAAKAAASM